MNAEFDDPNLIERLSLPKGAFGRSGEIELRKGLPCGVCGAKDQLGLSADCSEQEYSPCDICLDCLKKAVEKLEKHR